MNYKTSTKTIVMATLIVSCVTTACFFSCNNDDATQETVINEQKSDEIHLQTKITEEDYNNIVEQLNRAIKHSSRATGSELNTPEAQLIIQPMIDDGKFLRDQLVDHQSELSLTPQDVFELENMQEDQLADLSFTFASVYNESLKKNVTWEDFIDCLKQASGISDIESLLKNGAELGCVNLYINGTRSLITAATARQIVLAVAKRTFGIVGIAWVIYDFADCMKNKQQKA